MNSNFNENVLGECPPFRIIRSNLKGIHLSGTSLMGFIHCEFVRKSLIKCLDPALFSSNNKISDNDHDLNKLTMQIDNNEDFPQNQVIFTHQDKQVVINPDQSFKSEILGIYQDCCDNKHIVIHDFPIDDNEIDERMKSILVVRNSENQVLGFAEIWTTENGLFNQKIINKYLKTEKINQDYSKKKYMKFLEGDLSNVIYLKRLLINSKFRKQQASTILRLALSKYFLKLDKLYSFAIFNADNPLVLYTSIYSETDVTIVGQKKIDIAGKQYKFLIGFNYLDQEVYDNEKKLMIR